MPVIELAMSRIGAHVHHLSPTISPVRSSLSRSTMRPGAKAAVPTRTGTASSVAITTTTTEITASRTPGHMSAEVATATAIAIASLTVKVAMVKGRPGGTTTRNMMDSSSANEGTSREKGIILTFTFLYIPTI